MQAIAARRMPQRHLSTRSPLDAGLPPLLAALPPPRCLLLQRPAHAHDWLQQPNRIRTAARLSWKGGRRGSR